MKRGEPGCTTCNGYGFYYHHGADNISIRERCNCVIRFCPMSISMDHNWKNRKSDSVCKYCGLIDDKSLKEAIVSNPTYTRDETGDNSYRSRQ